MQHAVLIPLVAAAIVLLGLRCTLLGDQPGATVFSWSPGDARPTTTAGSADIRTAPRAAPVECPAGKALNPAPEGPIAAGDLRLGKIPPQGTVSFWVRLDRTIRVCPKGRTVSARLIHCADLTVYLRENDNGVTVNVEGGNEVRRPQVRGLASFELTHLRADQWYHLAVRYDAPKGLWRLILNGVLQPEPFFFGPFGFKDATTRIEFDGLMKPDGPGAGPARAALGPVVWRAGALESADVLKELRALKGWTIPPNRGEGVLETDADFDGEALGGDVIFRETFGKPLDRDSWVLEGPAALEVRDGRLEIRSDQHCVLWLKRKLPRDFVAAWDIQPSQADGLAIVFLCAMGADGRDLFDPTLARRTGDFNQYIRGDIRCYHFSYYAGTRGSANMRKNPGFYMIGMGPERIGSRMGQGARGPFRVVVARCGSRIECAVDGKRFLAFEDDGETYGPVHGEGYFGLRQMAHSRMIAYDNLVIRALKQPATAADAP